VRWIEQHPMRDVRFMRHQLGDHCLHGDGQHCVRARSQCALHLRRPMRPGATLRRQWRRIRVVPRRRGQLLLRGLTALERHS
jgi:hypothetical protein